MGEFSTATALLLCVSFVFAGLVKGVTGMGLPTVAMALMGAFMPPVAAAALLIVPTFVTNVWQFAAGPDARGLVRRLWPMLLGAIAGTLLGTAFLVGADATWSAFGLGLILLVYAAYALASPAFLVGRRLERGLSPAVGVVTGVITGSTGVSVMPAAPYLQALGLSKEDLVQALGLFFTVSGIALAVGLAMRGAFRVEQAGLSALGIVPAMAGMWLGQRIRNAISPQRFRQGFLLLLALLGLELVTRPFR